MTQHVIAQAIIEPARDVVSRGPSVSSAWRMKCGKWAILNKLQKLASPLMHSGCVLLCETWRPNDEISSMQRGEMDQGVALRPRAILFPPSSPISLQSLQSIGAKFLDSVIANDTSR